MFFQTSLPWLTIFAMSEKPNLFFSPGYSDSLVARQPVTSPMQSQAEASHVVYRTV